MSGGIPQEHANVASMLHVNQAIALAHAHATSEAKAAAQFALEADPQCVAALDLLARLEARSGCLDAAATHWRNAEVRSGRADFRVARENAQRLHRWRL